ncbi:MAG: hypothetical protein EOO41_04515 [Methanobacteriota archaeon]|nr:MAG: hypothetical protein EOO41_04515 [Euryarchaeota archaeon]
MRCCTFADVAGGLQRVFRRLVDASALPAAVTEAVSLAPVHSDAKTMADAMEQSVWKTVVDMCFACSNEQSSRNGSVGTPDAAQAAAAAAAAGMMSTPPVAHAGLIGVPTCAPSLGLRERLSAGVWQWAASEFLTSQLHSSEYSNSKAARSNDVGDDNESACHKCLGSGDLLCCDTCPRSYHLSCIGMSAYEVPQGRWICSVCKAGQRARRRGASVLDNGITGDVGSLASSGARATRSSSAYAPLQGAAESAPSHASAASAEADLLIQLSTLPWARTELSSDGIAAVAATTFNETQNNMYAAAARISAVAQHGGAPSAKRARKQSKPLTPRELAD